MLPTQHGRRRQRQSWFSTTLVRHALQQRGWQAFLGLLILVLLLRWKGSKRDSGCLEATASFGNKTAAMRQLISDHNDLIDKLVAGVDAVQDAVKCSPGQQQDVLCRVLPPPDVVRQLQQRHRNKMAVIVPYRDREDMLNTFLPSLSNFLKAQGREFGIFVMEQSPKLRFNRGLLLNAGANLLAGSEYDYFVFHDVDTIPTETGNIPYDYPSGSVPLHLTPPGIHPKVRYEDFFGGVTAFTKEQLKAVNGYGNNFWGWGREDDNMRERLKHASMWPPDRPSVPKRSSRYYFRHSVHNKAPEVRMRTSANGTKEFLEVNPDKPYEDALIISSQPGLLDDLESGLQDAKFWIKDIHPVQALAVKYSLELYCDKAVTPWCEAE